MKQNNRASPQQASAKASRGPSWESRSALRARASPPAQLLGPPKLCRGGFPASPPPGPLPKVRAWTRREGPRHASFSERDFHAGASSVRCSPRTDLPRWSSEGPPLCPCPTDCWSPWSAHGTATGRRGQGDSTNTFMAGGKPLGACPSRAFPVPPPRPSLSRPALWQVLPTLVTVLRAPQPQRQISRASGNHSYRSSTAALGGGQNPFSKQSPPPSLLPPPRRSARPWRRSWEQRGARPVHSEPPQTPPPRPPHHC